MDEILVCYWLGRWQDVFARVVCSDNREITVSYDGIIAVFNRRTGKLLPDQVPPYTVGVPHICAAELARFNCGQTILEGDHVLWAKLDGELYHVHCGPEDEDDRL